VVAGLGATLLTTVPAAAGTALDDDPAAAVHRLQQGLLELEREAPEASPAQRYQRLEPLVRATHDLPYMARLALGPDWDLLEEAQRTQFSELFARLGVASYAERFRGLAGEHFSAVGERELRGGRAEVRSRLVSPDGSSVAFTYVLHHRPGQGWRIINILAEGVSELALQRSEYRRVLVDQGWEGLVQHLKKKSELIDF
jgi:phospholipid transport system substrate-binding protein